MGVSELSPKPCQTGRPQRVSVYRLWQPRPSPVVMLIHSSTPPPPPHPHPLTAPPRPRLTSGATVNKHIPGAGSLHCYHQNDFRDNMGSDVSHFNVSLIVQGKLTRQCP